MKTAITGNETEREAANYIIYLQDKYNRKLKSIDINLDGEYAELNYKFERTPFERIRRITGYLVGTMDHWNYAKTAEEAERVKHDIKSNMELI